jgi:hypothetical protein
MTVMRAVREKVGQMPEGEPFSTARLLVLGPRAAVDQSLARLAREKVITRVRRGVYVRPKVSRLVGEVPPEPAAVINAIAEATGETVAPHGAEAARLLGLSKQVPLMVVYNTNGKTRQFQVGTVVVKLRHASNRQLTLAGTPAGTALAALRYLGKEAVSERTVEHVRARIGDEQFEAMRKETGAIPSWLSDVIWRVQQGGRTNRNHSV